MERLNDIDTLLFYWINQHHCPFTDWLMWGLSQSWSWMAVLVVLFLGVTLRREPRRWWVVLLGVGLCFLLSDRISVLCFKDVFCRLRPCHALDDVRMFRTTCGGQYGFISSHAANIFSLATFFALRYRKVFDNMGHRILRWLPYGLYLWAFMVGYSRPYLGKHYPGDVICGAIVGILLGLFVWWLSTRIKSKAKTKEKS